MSKNTLYRVLPAGRLIQGSTTELKKTNHLNQPLPENKHYHFLGIAVLKVDPVTGAPNVALQNLLSEIQQFMLSEYQHAPMVHAEIQKGLSGNFAWKIANRAADDIMGESVIFKLSTTLPIKTANAQNVEIPPASILRGYWVDASVSFVGNSTAVVNQSSQPAQTIGQYVNPQTVRLLGYDTEIVSGPSIEEQFAGHAPVGLPSGISTTPVAQNQMPQGDMGNGQPQANIMPQTGGATTQPMGVNVQPHGAILDGDQPQNTMPAGTPQGGGMGM